jgi:hypothetical protein
VPHIGGSERDGVPASTVRWSAAHSFGFLVGSCCAHLWGVYSLCQSFGSLFRKLCRTSVVFLLSDRVAHTCGGFERA